MTRSYRNNNPGNISFGPFAQRFGAVLEDPPETGPAPRFAKFPSAPVGVCALAVLLAGKYMSMTLENAMLTYAPPSENDTEAYLEYLDKKVGAPRTTLIRDLNALQYLNLLRAITVYEGYYPMKAHE